MHERKTHIERHVSGRKGLCKDVKGASKFGSPAVDAMTTRMQLLDPVSMLSESPPMRGVSKKANSLSLGIDKPRVKLEHDWL